MGLGGKPLDRGRPRKRRLAPQQAYVLRRLKEGADPYEIADELVISNAHLSVLLSRLRQARRRGEIDVDIPRRRNGPRSRIQDHVERLSLTKLDRSAIAERVGRSCNYVSVVQWRARKMGRLPPLDASDKRARAA